MGRPRASMTVVDVRPVGDVEVSVLPGPVKLVVLASEFVVRVSDKVWTLSGSLGAVEADWASVETRVRPEGVLSVLLAARGASMPQRGAGPRVDEVWVPSGKLVV